MRVPQLVLCVFVGLWTSACSIYPLPEDVMPFDSNQIASIIRCQTRDALRQVVLRAIANAKSSIVYQRKTRDDLLVWLQRNPDDFRSLKWEKFSPELREPFLFYKDTSVSYDFAVDT